ncbi:hypothetical protein [Polymorphospora rubra]|uniref:Lipoprotein n=1 Tax=Polymorphospora rubra TaxID=338584 RepID=A0A810N0L0_9ACTN|nr:hypothetical protein [Polymorphospora rubra]BCJ65125.1 hypothetical protein Prubr_21460 [Polymorphospora rubra]
MANHWMRSAVAVTAALALAGCTADIPEPDRDLRIAAECAAVKAGYDTWAASPALPKSQLVADTLNQEQLDQLEREAAGFRTALEPYQGEPVRYLKMALTTVERVVGNSAPGQVGEILDATSGVEAAYLTYSVDVCA